MITFTPKIMAVYTVASDELEHLIERVFGWEFSIVRDQELGNYVYAFEFDFVAVPLTSYDQECVDQFIKDGSGNYLFYTLMEYMMNEGILPSGTYLVDCTW